MEIKIINSNNQLFGVQKTALNYFHEYHERYPYLGNSREGEIITAKLVYQAKYPINQWASIPDEIAENTDRETRRIYIDSDD